ncbi:MAG: imidazolonepropionase [Thermoplasmata archaeon]
MSLRADLLVSNIGELATLARGPIPRTGRSLEDLSVRRDAALAARDGRIVWIGRSSQARERVRLARGGIRIDARGGVAIPGLVDAHSHAVFAGDRSFELPWKVRGASYAEIARRGGGILATVRATRRASDEEIVRSSAMRLAEMTLGGATTIEVKSGYALDHAGELRLLRLIGWIARSAGLDLVPTYLGAHAIPPKHRRRPEGYVDEIVRRTLPAVANEHLARFCDVFCEPGYFSVAQSERILRAALALGLGIKIHADEFVWSGGARLAARLHARSVEHLLAARAADYRALVRAGVSAVLLPTTPFATLHPGSSPGRELVNAGAAVALGSDCSPNSWITSMSLVLAHAVHDARLTPNEAISAATVNAAHAIDADDRAGVIAVGRRADFLLYDLPSIDSIPYRVGSFPTVVSRQGIPVSPPRIEPHI